FGGSNGSINTTVTGGTATYSYAWNGGATSANRAGLTAGTYTLTVTDANLCSATASATIAQPAAALAVATSTNNVSCFGGNNGSISTTVTGGTSAYSYAWNGGAASANRTGLIAGTYTLTVADANSCSATATAMIAQPAAALAVNMTKTDATCNGNSTGIANALVTGGTLPYTYVWSNNAQLNSNTSTSLPAGYYSVSVTDVNNCSANASIEIQQPYTLTATAAKQNVSCNGGNDGSIAVYSNGGTTPYTYTWSHNNQLSSNTSTTLPAGYFTVSVTDANNCSTTISANIIQPNAISIQASVADAKCNGSSDGAINLNVSGGTTPYLYSWNNAQQNSISNSGTLPAGYYTVQVTDANNCSATASYTINQPIQLTSTVSSLPTSCYGGNNGSATVSTAGGTAPYSLRWSNNQSNAQATNLHAGLYTVTVTDNNQCTSISSINVAQPQQINIGFTNTNIACNNTDQGAIATTIVGGTYPYSYAWNNGNTNANIANLNTGTYTLTVTDANNCTISSSSSIVPISSLPISILPTNITCSGYNNGRISTSISGGNGPYQYIWSNGSSQPSLQALSIGNYAVTVTDQNSCSATANTVITQPAPIVINTSTTPALCNGSSNGTITVVVVGGTQPYQYDWQDMPGDNNPPNRNDVPAGIYKLTLEDVNQCPANAIAQVGEPGPLNSTIELDNPNCFGDNSGNIKVTSTGGTAPYNYSWSNGATGNNVTNLNSGTYTVNIADSHNCSVSASVTLQSPNQLLASATHTKPTCYGYTNGSIDVDVVGGVSPYNYVWNDLATTQDRANISSGNYVITVTDMNGCTRTISVALAQPEKLDIQATINNVACYGNHNGSINTNILGGTTPYAYTWNTGETTNNIGSLDVGDYTISVSDSKGCSFNATYTITQPVADLFTSIENIQNTCYGQYNGSITVNATGGSQPYSYHWSTGATQSTLSKLNEGYYEVTITDANGCTIENSAPIIQLPQLALDAAIHNPRCDNGKGNIDITVLSGTAPISYQWNNGN
ncbi:MAG: SprB repeat-containing protein, partial [Bacteroidetes bacterium]|nr:SprB repeat-containing protein [Bacteroidota bacterium]